MINLAVIPARGGSKRIPGKNIRLFFGKPIITYAIETARKSGLFAEIMVSTDEKKIAEVAIAAGANVPFFRSKENSDDFAPLNSVVEEVINNYKEIDRSFDFVCCILPTSPLLNPEILKKAFALLEKSNFNTIWPLVKYAYPIDKALRIRDNKVEMLYPGQFMKRTQDFDPVYHDAGLFYFMKGNKSLMDPNRGGLEIDPIYVQDIDNESDWQMTELKYRVINSNPGAK